MLKLLIVPLVYCSLVAISYVVHDPFGDNILDFPFLALEDYVHRSCVALTSCTLCPQEILLFSHSSRVQKAEATRQKQELSHRLSSSSSEPQEEPLETKE